MLLELPHGHVPVGADKLVEWLLKQGIRPMIAHPERNKDIMRSVDKLIPFMRLGCLLQVTAGAVAGVVARIDGEERNIRARRGVVLCAGGFIMNNEMVQRHAPHLLHETVLNGNPNDNGMGIRIGMGAGGAVMNMNEGFVCLPFYPPADLVEAIMINSKGQRFINEDCYHGRMGEELSREALPCDRQPAVPHHGTPAARRLQGGRHR